MQAEEKEILEETSKLWNMVLQLEEYHPDDIPEMRFHIHAIQRIIMSREAIREAPELFNHINKKSPQSS